MTLHPASLILGWLSLALCLQWLPLTALLGFACLILPATLWLAQKRFLVLLRRARWLLFSLAILFAVATPGTALPYPADILGLTEEGCTLAATHALRLTLLLALLALLLEHLGIPALIAGLYMLLAPLGESRGRSRIALRLLLVLEYVEQKKNVHNAQNGGHENWKDWLAPLPLGKEYPPLDLKVTPLGRTDFLAMLVALAGVSGVYWWSIGV